MTTVVDGKRPLEIGDSSLSMSLPRYKRRNVSAYRDFPEGCGPNAVRRIPQINEEEICKQNEGCCPNAVGIIPQINEEEICEQNEADVMVKVESSLEKANSEENEGDIMMTVESSLKKAKSEEKDVLQNHAVDNKAMEVQFGLNEPADGIGNNVVDDGTNLQPCLLPYYPMPPGFVWREPIYPPRRKVSAVRDFPIGCGNNMQKLGLEEEHVGQMERGSKSDEVVDTNNLNTVAGDIGADVIEDKVESFVSEGVDTCKHSSQGDQASLSKSYVLKGQEVSAKETSGRKNEYEQEQLEYNKNDERDASIMSDELNTDLIVYVKDKNKRKKPFGVPWGNVRLQEESTSAVQSGDTMVIVQCLMSALHCPWSQGEAAIRSGNNIQSGNKVRSGNQVKKTIVKKKSDPVKRNRNEALAGKSIMAIPFLDDGIDEVSRPLDTRDNDDSSENDLDNFQLVPREQSLDASLPLLGASSSSERGVRSKVQETLRYFQAVYRKLLHEEEKSKDQDNDSKRADLQAAKILKERGMYINTKKVIGPIPGIEVGDMFNFRTELAIVGLHGPLQSGIDTIKLGKEAVATSIVASGGYANDVGSSDVLIYTGQGGNASSKDKQPEDQKLEKGNLALKNCIDKKTLVRVIRGFKETKPADTPGGRSKTISTYTYDGLYSVDRYFQEPGPHGKLVYKFELNRVPGQPLLDWKEMKQSKKI